MQTISLMAIKQKSSTSLTRWMKIYASNVSNSNQAEELHMTHILDRILYKQCQQYKSSKKSCT